MLHSYYKSPNGDFTLLRGDCAELLPQFGFKFDMVFANPPYFLSSGGISVQSGKIVCVDKGDWDKTMAQADVEASTLGADWEELFVNMNDGFNEGIRHKTNPWFSSQFHPEACSGPVDTEFIFDKFVEAVR